MRARGVLVDVVRERFDAHVYVVIQSKPRSKKGIQYKNALKYPTINTLRYLEHIPETLDGIINTSTVSQIHLRYPK